MRSAAKGALAVAVALASCGRTPPPPPPPPPPSVTVARPIEREVVEYREFTGRTAAVDTATLRARVTGYLIDIRFQDGSDVTKGDLLFVIDPRPYETALRQAEGNVAAAEARLQRQQADLARSERLFRGGTASQEEFDRAAADVGETAGSLIALRAAFDRAKLDLEFTRITAPIGGWIGRNLVDLGDSRRRHEDTKETNVVPSCPRRFVVFM